MSSPRHRAAGLARQLPQALAFGAEHQRQRLPQGHGRVLSSGAVEADVIKTLVFIFRSARARGFAPRNQRHHF